MAKQCFKCHELNPRELQNLYGYMICNSCRSKMGLYQDKTLKRYVKSFAKAKEKDSSQPTFEEEISRRLNIVEKDYISKKIKLKYIQERLKNI